MFDVAGPEYQTEEQLDVLIHSAMEKLKDFDNDESVQEDQKLREKVSNYVNRDIFNYVTPAKLREKWNAALEKIERKY